VKVIVGQARAAMPGSDSFENMSSIRGSPLAMMSPQPLDIVRVYVGMFVVLSIRRTGRLLAPLTATVLMWTSRNDFAEIRCIAYRVPSSGSP